MIIHNIILSIFLHQLEILTAFMLSRCYWINISKANNVIDIIMLDNLLANSESISPKNTLQEETIPDIKKSASEIKSKGAPGYTKRSLLNILLIIMCTFEVILMTNSKVYIDNSLIRSFLTFYADQDLYPELFSGDAYYIHIRNVSQLQLNLQYMLDRMRRCQSQTVNNLNYTSSNITLQVQYHTQIQKDENQRVFEIDLKQGIVDPFDLDNLPQLQQFLLKTSYFQIVVDDLLIQNQGLNQRYYHVIRYDYDHMAQIYVTYDFHIDNVVSNIIDIDRPQSHELFYLRAIYVTIGVVAFINFYFNFLYVQKAFRDFHLYLSLNKNKNALIQAASKTNLHPSEVNQIDQNIFEYVETNRVDINSVQWKDYLRVVEFDVVFALLASVLQIISNLYLIFGREHEQIVGLGCMFAWLTIFRTLQNFESLTLMYQLLKLSLARVIEFSVSFFLIFLGYTFLGLTVFPKVRFFASMSDSVTTLVSMMAGDSIDLITMSIAQKYSMLYAVVYIFSYVIIFMHAIHNTLVSIIKQYFIIRKIDLVTKEKEKLGDQNFLYIQELEAEAEKKKKNLPIKLTYNLQKQIFTIKQQQQFKIYNKEIRLILMKLQSILLYEKSEIFDHDSVVIQKFKTDSTERLKHIFQTVRKVEEKESEIMMSFRKKTIANEDL